MTSYSPAEAAELEATRAHMLAFYGQMMRAGANVHVIATALTVEVGEQPAVGATLHECDSPVCDRLTDTPARDEQAVFWMGENAPTYCDTECMSDAAEAQASGTERMSA